MRSYHLPTLVGQEQMPRLARQRVDYMIMAMNAYLKDQRTGADTAMTAAIFRLSGDDIIALAHYAASKLRVSPARQDRPQSFAFVVDEFEEGGECVG